jgi:hypothetical protein
LIVPELRIFISAIIYMGVYIVLNIKTY